MPTKPPAVFTVYKTTCLVNGKIYIGVHKTRNPHDTYLGSGKLISAAVKKYGRDHFTKEILFIYETRAEAYAKEKELVTAAFAKRADTYNVMAGGVEGPGWYRDRRGSKNPSHGTVWIWAEGEKPRKVKKEDLGQFLAEGWSRGRGPNFKRPVPPPLEKGRVCIHLGENMKYVPPQDLQTYLEKGWETGGSPKFRKTISQARKGVEPFSKGKTLMNRDGVYKYVSDNEVKAYLGQGWARGGRESPDKGSKRPECGRPGETHSQWGCVWIHNNSGSRRKIPATQFTRYSQEGWVRGMGSKKRR